MKNKKVIGVIVGVLILGALAYFFLFAKKTYTIVFDTAGGTEVETQKVKAGEKVVKPSDPLKDDYDFDVWELDGKEYDFDLPVNSDLVIKAKWKKSTILYKVTITVDDKKQELKVAKLTDSDIDKLFPPKEGYELKLYADGKEYDINTPLTGDVVLTGKYEKVANYTITFNSDGGSAVAKQTILPGETVKEPTEPTKEAYLFDGWYLGNTKYDFTQKVTKSITLVAKWKEDPNVKRYEVTFNSDGGSAVTKQRIIENKTAVVPKNPTKQGYQFVEWQLDGTKFDFKTKITKDITLKAKWKEVITYTVKFNSDGGTPITTQTIIEGNKATKPANPTKQGFTFVEWQLNDATYDFNTPVTGNIELKAVWEKEKAKFTVTFNSDGGSTVASQTVTEGNKATKPANPTKNGWTFKAWTLNGADYDFNTPVTGNIELKATWDEIVTYTIAVSAVDNYAPDRTLTVKRNGVATTNYAEIRSNDGSKLCGPKNPSVNASELIGQTTLKILLNDGREVVATIE